MSISEKLLPEIAIGIDNGPHFMLDAETTLALCSIAMRNNITSAEAIAVSLVNDNFLQKQVEAGGQLLVKKGRIIRHLDYI